MFLQVLALSKSFTVSMYVSTTKHKEMAHVMPGIASWKKIVIFQTQSCTKLQRNLNNELFITWAKKNNNPIPNLYLCGDWNHRDTRGMNSLATCQDNGRDEAKLSGRAPSHDWVCRKSAKIPEKKLSQSWEQNTWFFAKTLLVLARRHSFVCLPS